MGATTREASAARRNTDLRQKVVDSVKRRIVLGQLRPGDRVTEAELTESLWVSRPTAREALNQLARIGYLVQEAYRGHRVGALSPDRVLEIAHIRTLLDQEAAEAVIADRSGRALGQLGAAWERYRALASDEDPVVRHEEHIAFHRALWEAAGNSFLMTLWPAFEAEMTLLLAHEQHVRHDEDRALALHEGIVAAIRTGDQDRVSEALGAHTIVSAQDLAERLRAQHA